MHPPGNEAKQQRGTVTTLHRLILIADNRTLRRLTTLTADAIHRCTISLADISQLSISKSSFDENTCMPRPQTATVNFRNPDKQTDFYFSQ